VVQAYHLINTKLSLNALCAWNVTCMEIFAVVVWDWRLLANSLRQCMAQLALKVVASTGKVLRFRSLCPHLQRAPAQGRRKKLKASLQRCERSYLRSAEMKGSLPLL